MSAPAPSVADAARLARSGRYEEAHRVLDELGGEGSEDPAVLDLLARVHAQQGELAEADACWARVQEIHEISASSGSGPSPSGPGSARASARAGRRRIAALQARRLGMPTGRRLAVGALLLAVGAAVAGAVVASSSDSSEEPGASASPGGDLDALRDQQDRLTEQLGEVEEELGDDDRATQTPPEEVAAGLDGPGTTVSREADGLLITFDEGLFAAEETMTPEGEEALSDLGRRLVDAGLNGPLIVTGHTDDAPLPYGSPYSDRVNLGFARAQTVAEELATDTGIPLDSMGIRSTGTAEPPFPNDSAANRARNNTVTVLVGLDG
jgi:flagellar motor protein MotB